MTTLDILKRTKAAWPSICNASAEDKNRILSAMADSLQARCDAILRCNAEDMDAARGHISDVMLDRLYLDRGRVVAMADGIRATVALPDHTGRILAQIDHPNGMKIYKKQVPLGLVAIIYESRPNVTSDAAALAIKSGNVCMLRSGKEAFHTAKAIVAALKQGIVSAGGDADIVNIVEDTSHESATEIMQAKGLVDLLIPRGGAGLIRACVRNATVPCIETGTGICHVYVDQYADLDKAVRIIENAKTSRPSVCNAEEVCLVHRAVAAKFLPMLKKALVDDRAAQGLTPVELRLDAAAAQIIDGTPASDKDFDTEYLDYILAVGVVDSLDAAIAHVLAHSTHHSDAIVTEDAASAERFINGTDSAATYVNVSTPGSNLTGTSDYLDTAAVMNLMFVQNPDLQKVGLLYDLGQDSAASAIESAKAYLEDKGVEVIERTGTSVDEIALAAQALVSDGVEAVFTPTDNTVMKSELTIYETFAEAGIPHYTGADSFALNGAFLGYGVDYANLGVETANMIASILLDGADPAATAVKTFDNGTATINTEICEQLGIDFDELSEKFAPYCTKVQSIVTAESFDDVQ